MAWITPVTDWAITDYFNFADWERIDGDVDVVKAMLDAAGYLDIPLNTLVTPTIYTIPTADDINDFVENIDRVRVSACLPPALGLVELNYVYIGGANETAPDYADVNDWERDLELIYDNLPKAILFWVHCGVSATGCSNFRGHA
jgi:hypothetical protein